MKHVLALVFSALISTTPTLAAKSIVGIWDFPGNNCSAPIRLSALAMKSEDVDCRFATVKRKGNTVTWKGVCDDAEGSANQTVIAKLNTKDQLTIRYVPGGNVLPNLVRCGR
jgi:hypothetical protein